LYEYLYTIDRTGEEPEINEFSSDKNLIEESINAYLLYEYTDNLLEIYDINADYKV